MVSGQHLMCYLLSQSGHSHHMFARPTLLTCHSTEHGEKSRRVPEKQFTQASWIMILTVSRGTVDIYETINFHLFMNSTMVMPFINHPYASLIF
jgi:hypothetical protein